MKRMITLRKRRIRDVGLLLALCFLVLLGCTREELQSIFAELQGLVSPLPSPSPTTPVLRTPTPSPTPMPTATPAPSDLMLRFWVPDFLSPYHEETGAAILGEQVSGFVRMSSGVQVEVLTKKATGAGGLYDLLSNAAGVAPAIVPDLIVLNHEDLLAAVGDGLVQPLDDFLPPDAGYFDAALADVQTAEALWAFPYVAHAEQMAYRSTVTTTPPLTWTAVLSDGFSLVLPGGTQDGLSSDFLLSMYVGAGGRTVDDTGQVTLDRDVLERVYAFLLEARDAGLLDPEQALALQDTAACWQLFQAGEVTLTPVSVGTYWHAYLNASVGEGAAATTATPEVEGPEPGTEGAAGLPSDVLPSWAPTPLGNPVTVLRAWGLVVVTDDPARQKATLELVRWLVSAQQMGELTREAALVPTRRLAVESWQLPADEESFVLQLLSNSIAVPQAGADLVIHRALQSGLVAILEGEAASADAAASQALTSLRR